MALALARVFDRKAHGIEQCAADLRVGMTNLAGGILEFGLDTHPPCELVKRAHGRAVSCASSAVAIDHTTDHGPKTFRC